MNTRHHTPGRLTPSGILGSLLLATGAVWLLAPVLWSPVQADGRTHYVFTPTAWWGSPWGIVKFYTENLPDQARSGRISPIAYIVQHWDYSAELPLARALGTDLWVVHLGAKLIYLAIVLLCAWHLLRAIRVRWPAGAPAVSTATAARGGASRAGGIGPMSRPAMRLAMIAIATTMILNAQAIEEFSNSWTAYPLLTYLAPAVFLVSGILVLKAAEWVNEGGRGLIRATAVLVGWALFINLTYELYLAAVPAALALLAWQPTRGTTTRARWRPKVIVAGIFGAAATLFLVIIRVIVALADQGTGYAGVEPRFGSQLLSTWADNLVAGTAAPAVIHALDGATAQDVAAAGWQWTGVLPAALLVVGAVLLARPALAALRRDHRAGNLPALPAGQLIAGGATAAIGAALIMAVSVQAQERSGMDVPSRSTVFIALALGVVVAGVALALVRRSPGWAGRILAGVLVIAAIAHGGLAYGQSMANTADDRTGRSAPLLKVTHDLTHWDQAGTPQERCARFDILSARAAKTFRARMLAGVNELGRRWYGEPYCGRPPREPVTDTVTGPNTKPVTEPGAPED